ncbi:MAG: hypothetical protein ACI8X5_003009, partial [Planctomycetota bacterium]
SSQLTPDKNPMDFGLGSVAKMAQIARARYRRLPAS